MTDMETAVAVVGLSLRVPGAADPGTFWENLLQGRVSLPAASEPPRTDGLVPVGQLGRFAEFDAELFGMLPSHAALTDPQHRVLTELVWEALEDAALDTQRAEGRVGVFVGCGDEQYLHQNVLPAKDVVGAHGAYQIQLGASRNLLAGMLSYRLGFTGPSVTVQTACSTSLVAVHQAVRSLLTHECDIALAGGVTVHPTADPAYDAAGGGILSPDGRCRSFTETGSGTVPSSGVGVVVLRRAADLGDTSARALIVGSAVNNDGADRAGPTTPSPRGQAEALREALETAGVGPQQVGYIETHGTGTALGDQVELSALAEVYGAPDVRCALGAVKANVGHCDTAAGVVGLIKAVLAQERGTIPPMPVQPGDGPQVDLKSPRFFIPRQPTPWDQQLPPLAAVSSFGLGGTNAHVVLAPAVRSMSEDTDEGRRRGRPGAEPAQADATDERQTGPHAPGREKGRGRPVPSVVALSAATEEALRRKGAQLADWLEGPGAHEDLHDVAATLWHGRRVLRHRWATALPAADPAARARLRDSLAALTPGPPAAADPLVAAVLPGQGISLAGVGAELAFHDGEFAAHLAELHAAVRRAHGPELRGSEHWPTDDPRLRDTAVTQPLQFALGTAVLALLERRGVRPGLLLGHSAGEVTAAAYAGVLTPDDAAAAAVQRGALMAAATPGAMISVRAGEEEARELAKGLPVDVSGINSRDSTVLSTDLDTADELERRCRERGVSAIRLAFSHAGHSRSMETASVAFAGFMRTVPLAAPHKTVLSNLTGRALTAEQAQDPSYWGRQLRRTAQLDGAVHTLVRSGATAVVGLHGGQAVTNAVRQVAARLAQPMTVVDLFEPREQSEALDLEVALAGLWAAGCPVRFGMPAPARTVRLPAYPFAPTRHWIGATPAAPREEPDAAEADRDAADAPGTDMATVITAIWQDTFGLGPLRGDDNFFTMGGSSLQAAHLIAVIKERLAVPVALKDLYAHSDLGAFIRRIEEVAAAGSSPVR